MSVPVREWRQFIADCTNQTEFDLVAYRDDVRNSDAVLTDVEASALLTEIGLVPQLSTETLRKLDTFVASDTSPQMQARFSVEQKTATLQPKISMNDKLSRFAFILAYMYTFCSGFWLEQLASQSVYSCMPQKEGADFEVDAHPADMVLALHDPSSSPMHCLVSIKRRYNELHRLVLTFYRIKVSLYPNAPGASKQTKIRVRRFIFDTKPGIPIEKRASDLNRNVYYEKGSGSSESLSERAVVEDVTVFGTGDLYYELVRTLYEEWRWDATVPVHADELKKVDPIISQMLAPEVQRATWFGLTLEWLAMRDVRDYFADAHFLRDAIRTVRQRVSASNRPPLEPLDAEMRKVLFTAANAAIGDRGFSETATYAWADLLRLYFWIPLARLPAAELVVRSEKSRREYFDAPNEIFVIPNDSSSANSGTSDGKGTVIDLVSSSSEDSSEEFNDVVLPDSKVRRTKQKATFIN